MPQRKPQHNASTKIVNSSGSSSTDGSRCKKCNTILLSCSTIFGVCSDCRSKPLSKRASGEAPPSWVPAPSFKAAAGDSTSSSVEAEEEWGQHTAAYSHATATAVNDESEEIGAAAAVATADAAPSRRNASTKKHRVLPQPSDSAVSLRSNSTSSDSTLKQTPLQQNASQLDSEAGQKPKPALPSLPVSPRDYHFATPPKYERGSQVEFSADDASVKRTVDLQANRLPALLLEDARLGDRSLGYKTTLGKGDQGGKTGGIPGVFNRVNQMTSSARSTLITQQPGRIRSPDGFAPYLTPKMSDSAGGTVLVVDIPKEAGPGGKVIGNSTRASFFFSCTCNMYMLNSRI